ncbi:MAG: tetratricopeptide repeat protein [Chloroflexi bacterium]|nr:tetratricopeptide repeat protein [Chloroflexota bacterium]
MMSSEHIIEVNEASFQNDVVLYSQTTPVVVDFWAEWCQPCHMLSPILEKLAREANGAFRLAKVNADDNPNLTLAFNVRGLPTVKGFLKGQVVAEFVGAQPEGALRDFLRKLAPTQSDLNLEKGHSLLRASHWADAGEAFRQVLKSRPDDGPALLGLAKSHLAQGRPADALVVLRDFPASKQYGAAQSLLPLAQAMARLEANPSEEGDDDLTPAYARAIRLAGRGNLAAAADGLLEILRQNKNYGGGAARQLMVAVLELMDADSEMTRDYRREFSALLF